MCGICGEFSFNGKAVDLAAVKRMTASLRHRGPDAEAQVRPVAFAGLGHSRLKVIDTSEVANQPMVDATGRFWIVFNGEIYNFKELRRELESYGSRFATQSDTEVILQAYAQWGAACVSRLDGMFAFALLDLPGRQVLFARDRTGKKPLYYWRGPDSLVFASEIKGILANPEVPREIHETVLPLYLAYGYVPGGETFYRGIRQLPPATMASLSLEDGSWKESPYWQLNPSRLLRLSQAEAAAGIRSRLEAAVRKRLIADVPLGAFLSGGIDSTIVVGLMSRMMREPVRTFSIGFSGDARFDETHFAREAARAFGTKHTEFIVKPKAFELIERLVHHHDQPFGDASAIPTFLLCQLTKQHVTVALNGDGGDECFGGYRRFQAALISTWLPRFVFRCAARCLSGLPRAGELKRFCEAAYLPWDERLARWVSYTPQPNRLLNDDWAGRFPEDLWVEPARHALAAAKGASAVAQNLYFNFVEYLPNDLHVKMDRCSMAHGLEARSPFLDTDVVEFAAALPDSMKLSATNMKIILKRAFKDLLPPRIRGRGKMGFGVPLDSWFRKDLREAVESLLFGSDARSVAYLNRELMEETWQKHLKGRINVGLRLWSWLTLEVWLRNTARQPLETPPGIASFAACQ